MHHRSEVECAETLMPRCWNPGALGFSVLLVIMRRLLGIACLASALTSSPRASLRHAYVRNRRVLHKLSMFPPCTWVKGLRLFNHHPTLCGKGKRGGTPTAPTPFLIMVCVTSHSKGQSFWTQLPNSTGWGGGGLWSMLIPQMHSFQDGQIPIQGNGKLKNTQN